MGKNKPRDRKPKPMAGGVRIQALCPAQPGWRVLLLELLQLELDEDDDKPAKVIENPKHSLVDIAYWALLVEEDSTNRYQEMLPVVPTAEGTMEPVDPEDPAFISIITPSEDEDDISKMVEDYAEMLKEGDDDGE